MRVCNKIDGRQEQFLPNTNSSLVFLLFSYEAEFSKVHLTNDWLSI